MNKTTLTTLMARANYWMPSASLLCTTGGTVEVNVSNKFIEKQSFLVAI